MYWMDALGDYGEIEWGAGGLVNGKTVIRSPTDSLKELILHAIQNDLDVSWFLPGKTVKFRTATFNRMEDIDVTEFGGSPTYLIGHEIMTVEFDVVP